jgi:bifunctional DNase/RNase
MVEVTIDSVRIGLMNRKPEYQYVVLLRERASKRYLPIFIGQAEARAILIKLKNEAVPRPMTHDLLQNMIDVLGASLDSVIVNSLENDIFFAKIMLNLNGRQYEIDSRPSDALALAIRVDAPIFVDESVLDKAGISLDRDKETDDLNLDSTEGLEVEGKGGKVSDEEMKRLGAFRDFIDTLDMDDFDKDKS